MLWFDQSWLVALVDVSVKSVLLASLAAVALTLFRVRNTNVRHRVWTAVLVGMLTLPLLVPVTPTIPLPAWLTPKFPKSAEAKREASADRQLNSTFVDSIESDAQAYAMAGFERLPLTEFDRSVSNEFAALDDAALETKPVPAERPSPHTESDIVGPTSSVKQSSVVWLLAAWPTIVGTLYLSVFCGFALRILVGLWGTLRIVARSRITELARVRATAVQSIRNLATSAAVYESNELRVPLTVGFFQPKVLLPAEWTQWSDAKLEAVLAHESAHIRRCDYLVTLLGEVNRAIYWFHPLAWLLRSWLSELAEQSCDDAVIASTGERTQYARHLLEVAGSLREKRGRIAWSGVAMARKADVETRIDAILDSTRPLARHIGVFGALLLVATAVPAVLLAAALRPSGPAAEPVQADEVTLVSDEKPTEDVEDDKTPQEKGPKGLPSRISGKVLGPDGRPRRGAIVYAAAIRPKPDASSQPPEVDHLPISETTSDENGDFTLSLGSADNEEVNRSEIIVVAYAEGFGPDGVRDVQLTKNPSPTLRLVRDTPIEGRVLDTEGTPIEGVSLRLRQVITPTSDDAVTEWIENERPEKFTGDDFIRNDLIDTRFPNDWNHVRLAGGARPLPKDVVTGPDGRFRFAGIGSNRLAILEASGPSIAKQMLSVVTRPMYSIKAYPNTWEGTFDAVHYGATFNFVARPSQPIVGTITNLDGQPLVDATVFVSQIAGSTMSQGASFLSAKTDANGQFAISGAPQGGGHGVTVSPAEGEPYFETSLKLPSADGFVPIEIRFALPPGRWITGTVTDEATGEPIDATVLYYPFRANKYAENFPNYDPQITGSAPNHGVDTKEDGSFRILAIPGEGVLAARASKQPEVYLSDVPADLLERMGGEQMPKMYNPWSAKWFHSIRPVDIADDTGQLTQNLWLKKGLTRTLDFVDEDNQPLSGVRVLGRTSPGLRLEDSLEDSNVEIIGLTPGTPRIVVLLHEQKKLGRGLMLQPEQERMTVGLAPCAEVVGRLVDEDGEPIEAVEVRVSPESTIDNWGRQLSVTKTDDAGHFSVLLPPGHPCYVAAYIPDGPSFSAKIVPQPGTRFELGDIRDGTRLDEAATAKLAIEKQAALPKTKTVATVDDEWIPLRKAAGIQPVAAKAVRTRVRGQVLDPDGKGKAGATVYLVSKYMAEFMQPVKSRVLKQVTADADGRFDFEVELPERDASIDMSPNNSRYEQIIATADGFGPAVSGAVGIRQGVDVTLNLVCDDVPIEGQILNLEGQPVAGATLKVAILNPDQDIDELIARLVERTKEKPNMLAYSFMADEDFLDSKIDFSINETLIATKLHRPSGTPPQVTTDQQGRFRLTGIGRDRVVALGLSGPNIVTSWVSVITRDIKPIKSSVFIGGRTNTTYGAKFTYSAEPSQVIEGVVTDADTGTAIRGVLVHSSPYESGYAESWTDNEGRYRLEGIPKKSRHHLHLQPPRGEPYFGRDIDLTEVADGLEPTKLDLTLKRAKWIVGTLTDKATGEPVQGRVFFLPHIENPHAAHYPSFMKGRLLEPRHTQKGVTTTSDGAFRLPAIPGPGVLAVYAAKPHYCVGIGRDSLTKEWLGFERQEFTNTYDTVHPTWVHLLKIVEVPDDGDDYQVDLTVDPGNTLTLQLQDPAGQPLMGVRVHGRLPRSYAIDKPLETDRVAIQGIDPINPRPVFLYHPERNLARFLLADHESSQETAAKLLKCGTLKGRLVGKDGQPLPNVIIRIQPIGARPFDSRLAIGKTDKDGRFQTSRFVPNTRFKLLAVIARDEELRESIQLAPAQTLDLGDLTCDAAPPRRFSDVRASTQ